MLRRVKRNDRAGVGSYWRAQAAITIGLLCMYRKTWSVEELETLPPGTKPRQSHHRSPGGERRRERQRPTTYLERTRQYRCQSDKKTLELFQRGGAHMGFPERLDTILNRIELNWTMTKRYAKQSVTEQWRAIYLLLLLLLLLLLYNWFIQQSPSAVCM